MIEITAKLFRGPVYFTSEHVKCYVTFKNVNSDHQFPHEEQHQQPTGQASENNDDLSTNGQQQPSSSRVNRLVLWLMMLIKDRKTKGDTNTFK